MKLRLSRTNVHRRIGAVLAATFLAASLAPAGITQAAPEPPAGLDRERAIARAKSWVDQGVDYSQTGYKGGYRRDCSGFVSMAWDLPVNLVTFNIGLVAKPISKGELEPGDVLLNSRGGAGGRHAVLFEKWADKDKTKYWALEQTGQNGVEGAVRRVMPYPYRFDEGLYKPYRYTGMDGYMKTIPSSERQTVKGWPERKAAEAKVTAAKAAKRAAAEKAAAARRDAARAAEAKRAGEDSVIGSILGFFARIGS